MSFHLDLDLSADCSVWREMLTHEQLLEQHAAGKLGYTFQGLPPTVLRSFLTHRHTHSRLLPPSEQRKLEASLQGGQFSFDRNPNKSWEISASDPAVKKGDIFTLTRGLYDEQQMAERTKTHLPKDGRLEYLYAPDHLNRMDLHPRAAKTYTRGEWFDSHLRLAAKPADPHPGFRAHPETSTFRRVTTGRRHQPFPARATIIAGAGQQQQARMTPTTEYLRPNASSQQQPQQKQQQEEKEDSFHTPPQPITQSTPNAPLKQPSNNGTNLAALPSPAAFPRSMTPFLNHNTPATARAPASRPANPSWQSAGPSTDAAAPLSGSQSSRLPSSATSYTHSLPSSSHASSAARPASGQQHIPARPDAAMAGGFARHGHLRFASPRSVEPLAHSLPKTNAGLATHEFDHHSSFGRNGVYQAVPQTRADQGLQASRRPW